MKKIDLTPSSLFERLPFLINMASIAVLVYLAIALVTTPFYLNQIRDPKASAGASSDVPSYTVQSLGTYLAILENHPLFGIVKQEVIPASSPCDDFKNKYTLTGIVGGAENEAILGDRLGGSTRFVKAGDVVDRVTIKSVGSQTIVANCSGEELQIKIEES